MAEKIEIIVEGKDKVSGVFKNIGGELGKIGKFAAGAAVAGIAAVGVTAGAVAATSLKKFVDFERGMNEVFTLLPGISGEAMSAMEDQVKDLSREMGILPDEIVPALYQSLSAGVPQDNVFEFMETAAKASIGGVTDLETAVDGLTSVVNAFGSDNIDAARTADIMFTGVKLGKTTFDELSRSMFNVNPIASALGISFEEVIGATATLTKQGVPTSIAMTQMRQAMVAIQKPNADMVDLLEAAGFASGQAALDSDDFASVLQNLRQAAEDNGVSMEGAFGSVEALGAVLGLTGDNAATAAEDLQAMIDSAGAAETAFGTMDQGIGRTLDRLKAFGETALLTIGDALSPFVENLLDIAEAALPKVEGFITDNVIPAIEDIGEVIGRVIEWFQKVQQDGLFTIFEDGSTILEGIFEIFGMGEDQARELATKIIDIKNAIVGFVEKALEAAQPVIDWITNFVELKDILIAVGLVIGGILLVAVGGIVIALAKVILIIGAVIAVVAFLRNVIENDFLGIRTFIENAVEAIRAAIESALTWIQEFWSAHGENIMAVVTAIWDFIIRYVTIVFENVKSLFAAFKAAFEGDWEGFGRNLRDIWDRNWKFILEILQSIARLILEAIARLILNIIAKFQSTDWGSVGRNIVQGIARGITAAAGFIRDAAVAAARAALNAAKGFLGIDSPSRVFAVVGEQIAQGMAQGISAGIPTVQGASAQMAAATVTQTTQTTNNFNLTLNSNANSQGVLRDFDLLKAMAGA